MKNRYRIYRRNKGVFYLVDSQTGKRESLETKDLEEAEKLLHTHLEAARNASMNMQLARVYLAHSDATLLTRTWPHVMDEILKLKTANTKKRWEYAIKDEAFDGIRKRPLLQTTAEEIFAALEFGGVSTNHYLRRIHNFALSMNWLPWPIVPQRKWPQIHYKPKRAITFEEHQRIVSRGRSREFNNFLKILWHTGGSQGDIAVLRAEDINWQDRTITFSRKKTGADVILHFGEEAAAILEKLPKEGFLFPKMASLHERDRAARFSKRCKPLGIKGVSLHSYRYSWAERAATAGMSERWAQSALGHGSKAVARAYAKRAVVKVPSLEDYQKAAKDKIIKMPDAKAV